MVVAHGSRQSKSSEQVRFSPCLYIPCNRKHVRSPSASVGERVMALDWSGRKLTPISVSINPRLSPVGGMSPPLDATDPDPQAVFLVQQTSRSD
jgi:hypothetical protein